jgi:adenine-specific DNA-methyltransferase
VSKKRRSERSGNRRGSAGSKRSIAVNPKRRDGGGGGNPGRVAENYRHYEATSPMRPEIGTQPQFRKKKPPATYRYDSSLSPALNWDGQNPGREIAEWLLRLISEAAVLPAPHAFDQPRELRAPDGTVLAAVGSLQEAVEQLRRLGRPFLDWTGKAERLSFDVPTLPLFIHERLSTKAIVETLTGHKRDKQQSMFELFGDPQHSITDQTLRAYEYPDKWVNRLVLGDSLVVMNSLLHYESLGGQVQMIYMDPPYGVKFGSNFQPFVRRRDVSHNDDADMTREPEMVKAYRDTWDLGLHSYLTYMRDRLLLCRELLAPTGSIFVQISEENLHHVRELMDEVFGSDNFAGLIGFVKTSGLAAADRLSSACDYLLWYARDIARIKYRQLFAPRDLKSDGSDMYSMIELPNGTRRSLSRAERDGSIPLPSGAKLYRIDNLTKPGPGSRFEFEFEARTFQPGNRWWGTTADGMANLAKARRLQVSGQTLAYVRFWNDFPWRPANNLWTDTGAGGFVEAKLYVVQTGTKVLERCILATTDPGDMVLDPTCGSGTTAYVAEQWGRRWITIDTSRVPLTLARQRMLTATCAYFQL